MKTCAFSRDPEQEIEHRATRDDRCGALSVRAGCQWWIQARLRDLAAWAAGQELPLPARYHRLFRVWFILGWPAFAGVIAIFVLMIWKPLLW